MGLIPIYLGPSEAVKEDLVALDGFDLAFLVLIGQVVFTDSFDASFELVQKAARAKTALWGPQATLLGLLFKRAWKGEGQFLKEILDAFNLSGDISVDTKKIDRAFKKHLPKMGQRIWQHAAGEIDPILTDISLNSAADCVKQFRRQVRKADYPVDPLEILFGATPAGAPFLTEDFMSYYERATGNHLNAFASSFPDRVLHPEVERLVKYAEQAPGMRVIDKADLTRRIERISGFGNTYFSGMTDIQAGHLWNFTALEMAHNAGVSRYQVLSQRDKRTCPVCKRLDGKTFNVAQAYDKIQNGLGPAWQHTPPSETATAAFPITLANSIAAAFPFPRMNQIDNMSPAQIRSSGYFAPFHGRCRCQTIMLWKKGAENAPAVPYDFKDLQMHYGKPSTLGAKFMGPLQKKVKGFAKSEVASERRMWSAYKNCQVTDHPLVVLMNKETGDVVALAHVRKLKTMMSIDQLGVLGNANGAGKQMLQTVSLIAKKDGLALQISVADSEIAALEKLGAKKLKSGMYKFYKHQVATMADNLNPLIGDMTFMSWETTAAQEVISVATAVPKKPKKIPKPKVKVEPIKPKVSPAPTEIPEGKWELIPDTQLGSNPGGQYMGPDGKKYYAKFYENIDQARAELASAQIAKKFGLETFDTQLIPLIDSNGMEKYALVTKWKTKGVGGFDRLTMKLALDEKEELTKQYLHACLTGNWDVVGANYDNLVKFGKHWQCVDYGGTFHFRAKGGIKDFLTGEPSELMSLLDPAHKAGNVFSKFVPDELSANAKKYITWLRGMKEADFEDIMKASNIHISTAKILNSRREAMILHLEEFISAKKPAKQIKRRFIKKEALFKTEAHQKAYEKEYKRYASFFKDCPKDDPADFAWERARKAMQVEMKKNEKMMETFLHEWQVDSTQASANALRLKATQMETTKLNMVWKGYMDKDKITSIAKNMIPSSEYIRCRAATQAYLNSRGDKVRLWRGISGSLGDKYREKLDAVKNKFPDSWRKKYMQVDESGLMGWSSKKSVSKGWADVLMRDDKPNLEVFMHHDIWPKSVYKTELETLCLGFTKQQLQLGKQIADKSDIFKQEGGLLCKKASVFWL